MNDSFIRCQPTTLLPRPAAQTPPRVALHPVVVDVDKVRHPHEEPGGRAGGRLCPPWRATQASQRVERWSACGPPDRSGKAFPDEDEAEGLGSPLLCHPVCLLGVGRVEAVRHQPIDGKPAALDHFEEQPIDGEPLHAVANV